MPLFPASVNKADLIKNLRKAGLLNNMRRCSRMAKCRSVSILLESASLTRKASTAPCGGCSDKKWNLGQKNVRYPRAAKSSSVNPHRCHINGLSLNSGCVAPSCWRNPRGVKATTTRKLHSSASSKASASERLRCSITSKMLTQSPQLPLSDSAHSLTSEFRISQSLSLEGASEHSRTAVLLVSDRPDVANDTVVPSADPRSVQSCTPAAWTRILTSERKSCGTRNRVHLTGFMRMFNNVQEL
jgi:hypothetical protein